MTTQEILMRMNLNGLLTGSANSQPFTPPGGPTVAAGTQAAAAPMSVVEGAAPAAAQAASPVEQAVTKAVTEAGGNASSFLAWMNKPISSIGGNLTSGGLSRGIGLGIGTGLWGLNSVGSLVAGGNALAGLIGNPLGLQGGVDTQHTSAMGMNPLNYWALANQALSSGGVENYGKGFGAGHPVLNAIAAFSNLGEQAGGHGGGAIGDKYRALQQESQSGTNAFQAQRAMFNAKRAALGMPPINGAAQPGAAQPGAAPAPQPTPSSVSASSGNGGGGGPPPPPPDPTADWDNQMKPMMKMERKIQSLNLTPYEEQRARNEMATRRMGLGYDKTLASMWAQSGPALPNTITSYRAGFIGPDSTFGKLLQIGETARGQAGVAEIQKSGEMQKAMALLLAEHPDVARAAMGQWSGIFQGLIHGGQTPNIGAALQNIMQQANMGPQGMTQSSPSMQQLIPNIQQMPGMSGYLQNMVPQQPIPGAVPLQQGVITPNINPAAANVYNQGH